MLQFFSPNGCVGENIAMRREHLLCEMKGHVCVLIGREGVSDRLSDTSQA